MGSDKWTTVVEEGDFGTIRALLTSRPHLANDPITRRRGDGSTFRIHPLQVATQRDDFRLAEILIGSGSDATGRTPEDCGFRLAPAASPGLIDLLLNHGADLDLMHHNGTPLALAARAGNVEVVRHLVLRGASVNKPAPLTFETPLHRATFQPDDVLQRDRQSEARHTAIVSKLLEAGGDPNTRTKIGVRSGMAEDLVLQGETPLHFAARCGGPELIDMLLEAGADPKIETALGETSRDYAAYFGREDDVLVLLGP